MNDLEDFNRLVGYWRAYGLSEPDAHAKAEESMEDAEIEAAVFDSQRRTR